MITDCVKLVIKLDEFYLDHDHTEALRDVHFAFGNVAFMVRTYLVGLIKELCNEHGVFEYSVCPPEYHDNYDNIVLRYLDNLPFGEIYTDEVYERFHVSLENMSKMAISYLFWLFITVYRAIMFSIYKETGLRPRDFKIRDIDDIEILQPHEMMPAMLLVCVHLEY